MSRDNENGNLGMYGAGRGLQLLITMLSVTELLAPSPDETEPAHARSAALVSVEDAANGAQSTL